MNLRDVSILAELSDEEQHRALENAFGNAADFIMKLSRTQKEWILELWNANNSDMQVDLGKLPFVSLYLLAEELENLDDEEYEEESDDDELNIMGMLDIIRRVIKKRIKVLRAEGWRAFSYVTLRSS